MKSPHCADWYNGGIVVEGTDTKRVFENRQICYNSLDRLFWEMRDEKLQNYGAIRWNAL